MSGLRPDARALGPLAALAGEWQGDQGVDDSYVYAVGCDMSSPFRELSTFKPAGPAHNGAQSLYRLDYTTTAWRIGEETPFHTEIGYWFWDAEHEMVIRGLVTPRSLVTPRGIVVLAGGPARPDDTELTVSTDAAEDAFGVVSNPHLLTTARTTGFSATIDL